MNIEDQIAALLDEAEPLRGHSEDDPRSDKLGKLVDRINTLRAMQERGEVPQSDDAEGMKRKPGRPRKVVEGADG